MTKPSLISLALLSLAACASFVPGSSITDTRVLGVRVEVEGDAQRSSPRPGESAHVSLIVEGLAASPGLRWALAVCVPAGGALSACAGEPLGFMEGTDSTPELALTVPSESALGSATTLRVGGIVCVRGTPELTDGGARCTGDGADGTSVLFDLPLARATDGSDENLQPDLAETSFTLDEVEWTATAADPSGCRGQGLPETPADEREHDITIVLGPNVRELYVRHDLGAAREELQLSHFTSAGELSRQFSFVEPSDERERPSVQLQWTAPKAEQLIGDSQLVRMILVVRDMRGGIARTERALCVVR